LAVYKTYRSLSTTQSTTSLFALEHIQPSSWKQIPFRLETFLLWTCCWPMEYGLLQCVIGSVTVTLFQAKELFHTSVGVSEYSFILSTETTFVSRSDDIRTIQFSDCVTCNVNKECIYVSCIYTYTQTIITKLRTMWQICLLQQPMTNNRYWKTSL